MQDMRQELWNYPLPKRFLIGADLRLDSHQGGKYITWEVRRGWDETKALSITFLPHSTRNTISVFPRFFNSEQTIQDPGKFHQLPILKRFAPNLLVYDFSPYQGLQISCTHLAADRGSLSTQYVYTNKSEGVLSIKMQLAAVLNAPGKMIPLFSLNLQGRLFLGTDLDDQQLLVSLPGAGESGRLSAGTLQGDYLLQPRESLSQRWHIVVGNNHDQLLDQIYQLNQLDWQSEKSKIAVLEEGRLRIKTSLPDFNLALAASQKDGRLHLFQIQTALQNQLQSLETTAAAAPTNPSGQPCLLSPLLGLHLLDTLYPADPTAARSVLKAVLKPDRLLPENSSSPPDPPLPLTGELLWKAFSTTEDHSLLEEFLPAVEDQLACWFSADNDRDRDGIPEWTAPSQFELLSSRCADQQFGPVALHRLSTLESPLLAAFLTTDLKRVEQLAAQLGLSPHPAIGDKIHPLLAFLVNSWDKRSKRFQVRDRDAHLRAGFQLLHQGTGSGLHVISSEISTPTRITAVLTSQEAFHPRTEIILHGRGPGGDSRVERISTPQWLPTAAGASAVSEAVYSCLEYVHVSGLTPGDQIQLFLDGGRSEDIGELLPLWGLKLAEKQPQGFSPSSCLLDHPCRTPQGIQTDPHYRQEINLPLNRLIMEGLIAQGAVKAAAAIAWKLLTLTAQQAAGDGFFPSRYAADSGRGIDRVHAIDGLFPVGVLLLLLGIRITPQAVILRGSCPFNAPVSVGYRGITIIRERNRTIIQSPGKEDQVLPGSIPGEVTVR